VKCVMCDAPSSVVLPLHRVGSRSLHHEHVTTPSCVGSLTLHTSPSRTLDKSDIKDDASVDGNDALLDSDPSELRFARSRASILRHHWDRDVNSSTNSSIPTMDQIVDLVHGPVDTSDRFLRRTGKAN